MTSAVTRTRTSAISFFHFCIFLSVSFSQYLSSSISMAAIRQSYVYTGTILRMAEVILFFCFAGLLFCRHINYFFGWFFKQCSYYIHFPALLKSIQMK